MDGSQKWTHKHVHLNLFNLIRRGVSVSKVATNFSEKDLIVDKSIEKSFRQELENTILLATIFGYHITVSHFSEVTPEFHDAISFRFNKNQELLFLDFYTEHNTFIVKQVSIWKGARLISQTNNDTNNEFVETIISFRNMLKW